MMDLGTCQCATVGDGIFAVLLVLVVEQFTMAPDIVACDIGLLSRTVPSIENSKHFYSDSLTPPFGLVFSCRDPCGFYRAICT